MVPKNQLSMHLEDMGDTPIVRLDTGKEVQVSNDRQSANVRQRESVRIKDHPLVQKLREMQNNQINSDDRKDETEKKGTNIVTDDDNMMKDVTDDNNDNSNMNSTNNANKSDANDGNEMKDIGNNDDKHNENSNTHHEINP